MAAGATYTPIATTTLGSAAASYTFTSIPSTYTDLVLVVAGTASTTTSVALRFNGITTSTYSSTFIIGTGAAAVSSYEANNPYMDLGTIYTTQGVHRISIQNYANSTTYKTALSRSDDATNRVAAWVGLWRSTAAITSVEVSTGGTGTYSTGTTMTLYGIASAT